MTSRFVVIGAGIVGASIAYHLSKEASVTLIDKRSSPAAEVTGNSFGWFSGVGGDWPGGAEDLRPLVLEDYRRLEKELPGLLVTWSGSLVCTDTSVRLSNGLQLAQGQKLITQYEIASLEPNMTKLPDSAIYSPTDGGIDPSTATAELVRAAKEHGAQIILGGGEAKLKVVDYTVRGVMVNDVFYPADRVVIAAAGGAQKLCEPLGLQLPMQVSPAFWLKATAPPGMVKTILDVPEFEVRESRNGQLLMTALHNGDDSPEYLGQLAQQTIGHLKAYFASHDNIKLVNYGICQRPMPAHGPIIDYLTSDKSAYIAVMHSGITLAPTAGRLIARELLSGERAAELRNCSLPQHQP